MMQKFIVEQIKNLPSQISIQGQDAKHIRKVLRLTAGDMIHLTDGSGQDYAAKIFSISKTDVIVNVLESKASETESPIHITLCSGMLKDKKMDFIVKHVTQLGITQWLPFFCERSIPSPDAKRIEKRVQRWKIIAKESLKQCRRSSLPEINAPVPFENILEASDEYDAKITFWEKAEKNLSSLKSGVPVKKAIILIGPEGGFTDSEICLAHEKGFSSYLLGPRILRAETASISSCTLIQHILGDI